MSELVPLEKIEKRIYTIRGMIDQLVTNCDQFGNLKHLSVLPHARSKGSHFVIPSEKQLDSASLKDLGKKWFAFSEMDVSAIEMLQRVKI